MLYTMDQGQLLRVWTAMRFLGEIREAKDPTAQSEIITDTQMLLTAFVLDLKPLPEDQTNPSTFGTHPIQMVKLDA